MWDRKYLYLPPPPFVSRPGFYPDITKIFLRYLYSRLDLFSGAPGDVLSSNSNKNPSSFLSSFSKRSPQGVRPLYPYNKQYIETKVTFFLCFSDSLMSFDAMRHLFLTIERRQNNLLCYRIYYRSYHI
jgi:hypothetical protein